MSFENCPFELIFQAFQQLWPDIEAKVAWAPTECLDGALGRCSWDDKGIAFVEVSFGIPVAGACDILCHELAHAAVSRLEVDFGPNYHSPEWHEAYERLVDLYQALLEEDGEDVCAEPIAA